LVGAHFDGALIAGLLQVGGNLAMGSPFPDHKASFNKVFLTGAKIKGWLNMIGASFDDELSASSLEVGDSLFMQSVANFKISVKNVNLKGANIRTIFKSVKLEGAKIAGDIDMRGSSFDGELDADSLQVGRDLLVRDAEYSNNVNMAFARSIGRIDRLRPTTRGRA
jgi:hypothetical protein